MKTILARAIGLLTLAQLAITSALAWDYEGHRVVNQLAVASLPTNFPAFVRAATERIAFLSGEPDRWRNTPDLPLRHFNGPDHYIDLEQLAIYGLKSETLPVFRYDFIAQQTQVRFFLPQNLRGSWRHARRNCQRATEHYLHHGGDGPLRR